MDFLVDNYLESLYANTYRQLTFKADNRSEWEIWHCELKEQFIESLGKLPEPNIELEPRLLEEVDCGDYIRQRVVYNTDKGLSMPAYVLIPKDETSERYPAVVACHGHGYGSRETIGLGEDGRPDTDNPTYQKNFGIELVGRGFLVIVPELLGFGDRRLREDMDKPLDDSSCYRISTYLMMLGRTMAGMRVWETMRTIDYLYTRDDVDCRRIGCMGISGGGLVSAFTSAIDERISCSVVSGFTNTFKDSIMAVYHCIDNFIPGIINIGEMYDIIGLIAPRPLLIEAGSEDPIFPIDAVYKSHSHIGDIYKLLDVKDRLKLHVFEGEHEISGEEAYPWLEKWLIK